MPMTASKLYEMGLRRVPLSSLVSVEVNGVLMEATGVRTEPSKHLGIRSLVIEVRPANPAPKPEPAPPMEPEIEDIVQTEVEDVTPPEPEDDPEAEPAEPDEPIETPRRRGRPPKVR